MMFALFCFTTQLIRVCFLMGATLNVDRHGNPSKRALRLVRRNGEGKGVHAGKPVLSFSLCVSNRLNRPEQLSPEGRITQTVSAINSQTWPTNLTTFPVPRMDNTSPRAASCSAAHSIKTPTVVSRVPPPLIHA